MEAMIYVLRGALILLACFFIPTLIGAPIEAVRTGHILNKESRILPFEISRAWGYGMLIIGLLSFCYVLGSLFP